MSRIVLETVPNVSEGRDEQRVEDIGRTFATHGCSLLDVHTDAAYNRSVFTLVGDPQEIADTLVAGARAAIECIDMRTHEGAHPCIGALDVVPIVYLTEEDRVNAQDEALGVANRLAAELELPVFVYGELAKAPERRERSYFRDGGVAALGARLREGDLEPDFGPVRLHPTAGATMVAARPPLVAFNVELDATDVEVARAIAAAIRERDGGLPGVRAIGVAVGRDGGCCHVSANVEDPFRVPLAEVVEAVRREAAQRGTAIQFAELVGLAPEAALQGFPPDVEIRGFDEHRHILEHAMGRHTPNH
jgi:glutamate formiminotransferase / 5-formyltetrahydrofolate cyclo-ligase